MAISLLRRGDAAGAVREARGATRDLVLRSQGHSDELASMTREGYEGLIGIGVLASLALEDVESAAWFLEMGRGVSLRESLRTAERLGAEAVPPALRDALDLAHFLSAGAVKINQVRLTDAGLPEPDSAVEVPEGNLAIVEIPPDYQAMKTQDHGLAVFWRQHTRHIFQKVFKMGHIVTDFIFLKGGRSPRSYYILSHGEGTLG